ncbi:MAG: hypothetical protein CMA10_04850 [Euryarchaeota archaeon]|nr:hypothetical protein [Euryarchaeota archaeon]|tara:strand:+ start:2136 stop:2588 length:453 start_codon:yes stop_codon:yes gene_type:complete
MQKLPEHVLEIIFRKKHAMEWSSCMREIKHKFSTKLVDMWKSKRVPGPRGPRGWLYTQVFPTYPNKYTTSYITGETPFSTYLSNLSWLKFVDTPERIRLLRPSSLPSPLPFLIDFKKLKKTDLLALLKENSIFVTKKMSQKTLIKLWMQF